MKQKTFDESPVQNADIQRYTLGKNRCKQIGEFVENDDLNGFKLWGVTKLEMNTLRFEYNMNLLQLVCHEEATNILNYLVLQLENDKAAKKQMVEHRDGHLGSQAIHLAAATGNHIIIETLIVHFNVNVYETTLSK